MLEWTGERFLPWIEGAQIHYEHLHRYAFAAQFVKGKKVLDLACGEGYGSYILAQEADSVVGVDIDERAINHAQSRYLRKGLHFIKGSITEIPIEGEQEFDVIVCFEAIEHIKDHDKLLSEVKRLIKDDGVFIVSTPNKATYTDAPGYNNPFHLKELYFDEFEHLLRQYFKNVRFFGQKVYTGSNIWDISLSQDDSYREFAVEKADKGFNFAESDRKVPLYFVALTSDVDLEPNIFTPNSWLVDVSDTIIVELIIKDMRIRSLETDLQQKSAQIGSLETDLRQKSAQIGSLETDLRQKSAQIGSLETDLRQKSAQIGSLEIQIQQINRGIVMQLLTKYQRVVNKLLPLGSRRRNCYELGLSAIRIIINEGWGSFWSIAKDRLRKKKAG